VRINFVYMRPTPVLYFGATGPYEQSIGQAWDKMLSWLDARNLRRKASRGFGIIHDHSGSIAPPLRRYDACVELVAGFSEDPSSGIVRKVTPSGAYAQSRLQGCHGRIADGFQEMRGHCTEANALAIDETRPCLVIYLNDPATTARDELLTQICVPVGTTLRIGELRPAFDA
jgi:AraC family transcriptional regulator